jgi:hypothetical protein
MGYWVEIKPCFPNEVAIDKLMRLTLVTGHHAFLFWGNPDFCGFGALKAIRLRKPQDFVHVRMRVKWPARFLERSVALVQEDIGNLPVPLWLRSMYQLAESSSSRRALDITDALDWRTKEIGELMPFYMAELHQRIADAQRDAEIVR